eukprot:m.12036 g.12036  ORF g.12036 m.12036 type:complete len:169 (-) comp9892_c0_seq1:82-588(-)
MDKMQPLQPYTEAELPKDVDISKLGKKTAGNGVNLYYRPLPQFKTPSSSVSSSMKTPRAARSRRANMPSASTPEMRSLQTELAKLRRQKQQLTERIRKCKLVETYRKSSDTKDLPTLYRSWKGVAQQALQDVAASKDGVTILDVLAHYKVEPSFVDYNPEEQEFETEE